MKMLKVSVVLLVHLAASVHGRSINSEEHLFGKRQVIPSFLGALGKALNGVFGIFGGSIRSILNGVGVGAGGILTTLGLPDVGKSVQDSLTGAGNWVEDTLGTNGRRLDSNMAHVADKFTSTMPPSAAGATTPAQPPQGRDGVVPIGPVTTPAPPSASSTTAASTG